MVVLQDRDVRKLLMRRKTGPVTLYVGRVLLDVHRLSVANTFSGGFVLCIEDPLRIAGQKEGAFMRFARGPLRTEDTLSGNGNS